MVIAEALFTDLRDGVISALITAGFPACEPEILMTRSRVNTDSSPREMFFSHAGPVEVLLVTEDLLSGRPAIRVEDLILTTRGEGIGTLIMRSLIRTCAAAGVDITLCATPLANPGSFAWHEEMEKLKSFYSGLGFVNAHNGWDGDYILHAA